MYDVLSHSPRVVVVGYGRWGRQCHTYLINRTSGLTLHGVVSSSAEKRQQAEQDWNCRTYAAFEEALADPQVDVIVLATPNATHAKLSVAALQAGKHVVTDKVMCLDLAECDAMIAAARASRRLLTVFQNRRLDGDFLTVQNLLSTGWLGDLRWAEMSWQGFGAWGGWRGKAAQGGGKLYDLGAHLIDQALLLFPAPVAHVYCRRHYDWPETDTESEALIVIAFQDGRTAVLDMSSMAMITKPRFYLRGTEGTFIKYGLDPQEKAQADGDIDAAKENPADFGTMKTAAGEERVPTIPGRWQGYYENLRDALLGQAQPMVTLEQARRVMEVIETARNQGV